MSFSLWCVNNLQNFQPIIWKFWVILFFIIIAVVHQFFGPDLSFTNLPFCEISTIMWWKSMHTLLDRSECFVNDFVNLNNTDLCKLNFTLHSFSTDSSTNGLLYSRVFFQRPYPWGSPPPCFNISLTNGKLPW